jgi:hypothetical protein
MGHRSTGSAEVYSNSGVSGDPSRTATSLSGLANLEEASGADSLSRKENDGPDGTTPSATAPTTPSATAAQGIPRATTAAPHAANATAAGTATVPSAAA